jgi:hypothetical protein
MGPTLHFESLEDRRMLANGDVQNIDNGDAEFRAPSFTRFGRPTRPRTVR